MRPVNEKLQDAAVGHQVDQAHFSNGAVHRIIALLNRTDADLAAALQQALDQMDRSQFSVDRLESLLQSVRALNLQAYNQVGRELTADGLGRSE